MYRQRWAIAMLCVYAVLCSGQEMPANLEGADAARLPVKRVVLYKNGVGYFEHSARVRGTQELGIDFTTGQLNDVLKSLTVVDLGGGQISGIRYNSIAPLDERLRALRLPFGEQITRAEFLSALRGSRVEVSGKGESATGRLLSVEQEERTTDSGTTYHATDFSIVTDSGEMRNFELGSGVNVRLAERDLNDEVGRYLNLVGSSRARDLRRMTVSATGNGDREVFVSYISEVPVWKSTYRIILPEKSGDKPLLQGWAIVDNTIGEDWKDVQLALIAGAPQSFIQDISQPLYARRPEIALPQSAMLTPQTHEATMKDENGPPPPQSVAAPAPVGEGRGGGIGGGTVGGLEPRMVQKDALMAVPRKGLTMYGQMGMTSERDRLDQFAQLQNAQVAQAQELGDYFEYNIKQAITIGKNQSALVPILQSRIDAEKVTLWTANANQPALRALWVKNASGLTLDSGTFNIIDSGTFAGEGLIETLHPNERRLLSYAADTAVRVSPQYESRDLPVSRIQILKGVMFLSREHRDEVKYTIRNSDTATRQVVIEHPVRAGWKLADANKPEETSASHYRFRVSVEPDKTQELTVEESHQDVSRSMLTDITDHQVEVLAVENVMTPEIQAAFRRVLDQKNQISRLQSERETRQKELESINSDQARIRENMKALKGSTEEKALLARYTHQLDLQEDRLNALHKEISDLQVRQAQEQQKLEDMVQHINL
ncbi:MAG TPA: hypothetical protein VFA85_14770 [Terriglobales bacterium]|nr:hypothetical protein [Terriglobales bacterium]